MISKQQHHHLLYVLLAVALLIAMATNIALGSVNIPFEIVINSLFGKELVHEQWAYIILEYRLPKAITALFVGAGLSLSGLLMQTLFKNPLAGPYVLGISSGASLGAALFIMGAAGLGWGIPTVFGASLSTTLAASIGSFSVLFIVSWVAKYIKNAMALLIIGLMFGSLSAAIVSILAFFSDKESLQRFIFWSYGNLGNITSLDLWVLIAFVGIGVIISLLHIKSLNGLLLGNDYAQSIGVSIRKVHLIIILATGLMAGSITAIAGPIAFIGLAVPHICRLLWSTSNHKILIPTTIIMGAVFMLLSDTIAQLPGSTKVLPINAITAIFGAPIVIWLLVRKKQIHL